MYQFSIADLLNQMNEPIAPGDYVEHQSKPGVPLLVIKGPYRLKSGNICVDVKEPKSKKGVRVRMDYIRRV
jgi:hypothetical protein